MIRWSHGFPLLPRPRLRSRLVRRGAGGRLPFRALGASLRAERGQLCGGLRRRRGDDSLMSRWWLDHRYWWIIVANSLWIVKMVNMVKMVKMVKVRNLDKKCPCICLFFSSISNMYIICIDLTAWSPAGPCWSQVKSLTRLPGNSSASSCVPLPPPWRKGALPVASLGR